GSPCQAVLMQGWSSVLEAGGGRGVTARFGLTVPSIPLDMGGHGG
ncbi:MAG: hypothetical protein IH588_20355, partial [Anaerolineales bacterium]|nr:hypothetical protein [Anaerolineales bacterium]